MPQMNQNQQRYVMRRIEEIRKERESLLREKFTTVKKEATDKQKLAELCKGHVDIVTNYKTTLKTPIGDCVRYWDLGDEVEEFDQKGFDKAKNKLRKEVAKITDEVMLGDAAEARDLFSKFEATV